MPLLQKVWPHPEEQEATETQKGKKSRSNQVGLLAHHVLGVQEAAQIWIVDSGAT